MIVSHVVIQAIKHDMLERFAQAWHEGNGYKISVVTGLIELGNKDYFSCFTRVSKGAVIEAVIQHFTTTFLTYGTALFRDCDGVGLTRNNGH